MTDKEPKALTGDELVDWIIDVGRAMDVQAVPLEAISQEALNYMVERFRVKTLRIGSVEKRQLIEAHTELGKKIDSVSGSAGTDPELMEMFWQFRDRLEGLKDEDGRSQFSDRLDPEAMMPGECDMCHGDDRFVYLFHGIMQCGRCALKIYTALSEAELAALRQMATAATESLNDE